MYFCPEWDFTLKNEIDKLIPSTFKVGSVNPLELDIEKGLKVEHSDYLQRRSFYNNPNVSRNARDAPSTGEISQINIFIRFSSERNGDGNDRCGRNSRRLSTTTRPRDRGSRRISSADC